MAAANFVYVDFVKRVVTAANARVPRLQPSAITFISELASREVAAGNVNQVGDDVLTADGKNAEEFVNSVVFERTGEDGTSFLEVPKEVVEVTDQTWLSGSLTEQGIRYNQIRAVFGKGKAGDDLAKAAFIAEAAIYSTVPGSTKPGIAPGSAKVETEDKGNGVGPRLAGTVDASANPWKRDEWRGTEEARQAKMQFWLSHNTAQSRKYAHDAGCTLDGRPLHATRYNF